MKKRIMGVFLAVGMVFALLPAAAWAEEAPFKNNGGDGTEDSPYEIATLEQLEAFRDYINADADGGKDEYFKLTADIDMTAKYGEGGSWDPIGSGSGGFTGEFNGAGHTVKVSFVAASPKAGLFAMVGSISSSDGTVSDLGVSGSITGAGNSDVIGGIVGENYGHIERCYSSVNITGKGSLGGIVGRNTLGSIRDCYNTGDIVNSSSYGEDGAGGIVGNNYSGIMNCYNTGKITQAEGGLACVGGIAGLESGIANAISNCYYLTDTVVSERGIGDKVDSPDKVAVKTAEEFQSLAADLNDGWGSVWKDSPLLGRPVFIAFPEGGDGTAAAPYTIPDLATLEAFREYINSGKGKGEYFKLTAEIDMSDKYGVSKTSWTPIGTNSKPFNGTFDGGGHTISGLYIYTTTDSKQGLFGCVSSSGTIQNLTVSGSVTGSGRVGGIVGENYGVISDCINNCNVKGNNDYVGGIVGYNYLSIKNCYNTGTVSNSKGTYDNYIGGIVGYNNSTGSIENCHNKGTITGVGDYAGGIAGSNNGSGRIENCYNTGAVNGTSSIGGIAGSNDSSNFENCYNTGSINGTSSIGGIAGLNNGSIENCYYLDTCGAKGEGTLKTEDAFNSGEVAWLLQSKQDTPDQQVWGQKLSDEADKYPVLTTDATKKVLKVTFATQDNENYATKYTNPGGTVEMPENPSKNNYTFEKWSQSNDAAGREFNAKTAVTEDITVYAVGREHFGGDSVEIPLSEIYGYSATLTVDLDKYMKYANGSIAVAGKFSYEISNQGDTGASIVDDHTLSVPTGLNAGHYTITVTATEKDPQYSLMSVGSYGTADVTLTVKVSIAKATATVTAPTANTTLTYTGTAQELIDAGSVESVSSVSGYGEIRYSLDGDTYSADIPTGEDAKTYTVYWKVEGANETNYNYVGEISGRVTATIGKAASEVTVTASETPTYGNEITLTATVTATGVADKNNVTGTVQFKVGGENFGDPVSVDTSTGTATLTIGTGNGELQKKLFGENGTTNVTAVYEGNDNIKGANSEEKSVTVGQKELTFSFTADEKTYDGGTDVKGTLTRTTDLVSGDSDVQANYTATASSKDVNDSVDVTVHVTLSGSDAKYYTAKDPTGVTVKIVKAEIGDGAVTAPTVKTGLTYDGTEQGLIQTGGSASGGTMKYYVGGKGVATQPGADVVWQDSAAITGKDAGTYTVWYKVVGDDNHNDTSPASITVEIAQKEVTLEWKNHEGLTYTGKAQNVTADFAEGQIESDDMSGVTVNVTDGDKVEANPGEEYTATATLEGERASNYKLANATQTYTIEKATVEFEIEGDTTFTYDTKTHTVKVKEKDSDATQLPGADSYNVLYTAQSDGNSDSGTANETDVGTYKVWVKLSDKAFENYQFEGGAQEKNIGTMTINQAALTLDVTGAEITYGQALSESELTGTATIDGGKEIDGTWAWETGSVYPTVSDSDTTGYKVTFTPSSGERNFTDASKSKTITITVNPFTLTPQVDSVDGKVYDGNVTAQNGKLKFKEDLNKEPFSGNLPSATGNFEFTDKNVGTSKHVNVTGITLTENAANYTLATQTISNAETSAEITAKEVALTWALDEEETFEITYDGNAHNVTATATTNVGEETVNVTVTDGTQTNAGSYTARASGLTNGEGGGLASNYKLPESVEKEYTIKPAEVSFTIDAEDKVEWSTRGETNADPNPDGYKLSGSGTAYALSMTYDSYGHTANVAPGADQIIKAADNNGYKVTYKRVKDSAGENVTEDAKDSVRDAGTYEIWVTINPVDGAGDVYNFKFADQDAGTRELKIGTIEIKPYEVTVIWTHLSYVYHAHTMHPDIRVQNPFKNDNNQLLPGQGLPEGFETSSPESYTGEYLVAFGATEDSDVGEYTVTAGLYGQKAANYTVKNPTATVTIVPAPVTFTVSDNVWDLTGAHPSTVTLSPVWGVVSTAPDKDVSANHQYPKPGTAIGESLNTEIVYKMDGKEITAPDVPTEAGTYEVWVEIGNTNFRHSATSDGASHKVGELVLTNDPDSVKTYKVTFETGYEGGTAPAAMENLLEGQMVIIPAGLTRDNYLFQGWSHGGITYRPNEEFPMPASDVTFKAEWLAMEETRSVGGTVVQEVEGSDPKPLLGATVTLKQGDNEAGEAITDADGNFLFEHLTPGIYNLEVRYFNGSSTVVKTFRVDLEKESMDGTYILPDGALNTVVEADVTAVVDMQDIVKEASDDGIYTKTDAETVEEGGTVEFKMTVKGTELEPDQIKELPVSEEQIGMVLDLELTKTVKESSGTTDGPKPIDDSIVPITTVIHLPAEIQGKSGYTVYRFHDLDGDDEPEMQTITTSRNASGEYLQVIRDGTAIEIHATLYSVYVLTWYQRSGGGGVVAYPVTLPEDTEHGDVSVNYPNAAPGVNVTLTVTPDEGYELDELTVTDRNGNIIPVTDNGDGTYSFTMPSSGVVVSTEFKLTVRDGGDDCPSRAFPDLDVKAWYHEYTDYVIETKLMQGSGGLFKPNGTLTRAEMVTVLWNMNGRGVVNYLMTYGDVSEEDWYAEAIRWATSEGVVDGYDNGNFGPNDKITREQMAKMLYNYEKKYGDGGFTGEWMFPLPFADTAKINDWAYEAVAWCYMNGVINGKDGNVFDPAGNALRCELAKVLTVYSQIDD